MGVPNIIIPAGAGLQGVANGGTGADLSAAGPGHVIQASAGAAFTVLEHNLAGTQPPDANDDNTTGMAVGSIWVDETNDRAYICVDASTGAAKWRSLRPAGAGLFTFSYAGETNQSAIRPLYSDPGAITDTTVAGPISSQAYGMPAGKLGRLEVHCVDGTTPTMDQVIVRRSASGGTGGATDVYDSGTGLGLGRGEVHIVDLEDLGVVTAEGDWLLVLVKSLNANPSRYYATITVDPD